MNNKIICDFLKDCSIDENSKNHVLILTNNNLYKCFEGYFDEQSEFKAFLLFEKEIMRNFIKPRELTIYLINVIFENKQIVNYINLNYRSQVIENVFDNMMIIKDYFLKTQKKSHDKYFRVVVKTNKKQFTFKEVFIRKLESSFNYKFLEV